MKIAIISSSLEQGGSQRFVYEHAIEFAKMGHECVVITKKNQPKFYVNGLVSQGINVLTPLSSRIVFSRLGCQWLTRLSHTLFSFYDYLRIRPNEYDLVLINQIECYNILSFYWPVHEKTIVLLMSHKFQYAQNPYAYIDSPMKVYIIDEYMKKDLVESGVKFDFVKYPLSLDIDKFRKADYVKGGYKIGYFARLSAERPIEFIFFAFHLIVKRLPQVVLHIFGDGELSLEQNRLLKFLGIKDNVVFEGHAESLACAIEEKEISLAWLTALGDSLGYGSIEIMLHRVPLVMWNLDPSVVPSMFLADSDLQGFVDKSIHVLEDPGFAEEYIDRHYQYVCNKCNIALNAPALIGFAKEVIPDLPN